MNLVLANARAVTPAGVLDPALVEVADGRIATVRRAGTAPDGAVDLGGRWLVPGFVDVHVHGGGGATFDDGDPEEAARVVAMHRAHGTTTMLASVATAPMDMLARAVAALADLARDGLIAGIHLEGPFLATARCGAHDSRLLRAPAAADIDLLLAAGRGAVRMVTLAPELDGGLSAVRRVVDAGALAAVGHTDADYEVTAAAVDAGASVATHLFNAMPPLHHRAPGPVAALLEDSRVTVELINDGAHLHDAVVTLTIRSVGPGRVAFVTDAMAAAGSGDGRYRLAGRPVTVRDGVARLAEGGSIAGSTLTADTAVRRAVRCGVDIVDAVSAAATTPARLLGLQGVTGAIDPGLAADLVVLDDDLRVDAVMCRGRWLHGGADTTAEVAR
ncbi:MAG: N-acetylglucosamine-6-phosphate deacetylase [Actinomycetota bacterium]|nr:N-acetylglucosamine-6-phosphate deacetylase [Actinomycetota bacterium]